MEVPERKIRKTPEQRQREVIDAAIGAIGRNGLSNTTLADIAKRAGIGYGNLSFRFRNKDELLVAALRTIVDEYVEAIDEAASTPGSDAERLDRVLTVAFSRKLTTRNKLAVWAAFWAESQTRPAYKKLFSAFRRREGERMMQICRGVIAERGLGDRDPVAMAVGINALIEGLWSHMAHGGEIDRDEGLRIARVLINLVISKNI